MRTLLLALCLILIPGLSSAGPPAAPQARHQVATAKTDSSTFVRPYDTETYLRPRTPPANQLVYERAVFHAQHRAARMEARKWLGYSSSRPQIRGHWDATSFPRYGSPWWHAPEPPRVAFQVP